MIPIDSSTSSKASPLIKSNSITVLGVLEDADDVLKQSNNLLKEKKDKGKEGGSEKLS